ncbi:MAG: hypothetical protein C0614_12650 [Desulfuromonas sp.]|nr:MAG: hypothetical protein C0614_12650 [Desulfuromonas sp.]
MRIQICVNNFILAEGIKVIIAESLRDAIAGHRFYGPNLQDPDIVLFDSQQKIDDLKKAYPQSRFICLDLGLKEAEIACLLSLHGVQGIISPGLAPSMFGKALRLVCQGEIWAEQCHLKALLGDKPHHHGQDLHKLSVREVEIVRLVASGLRNREIADHLYLSEPAVKSHLSRIYKTLHVPNRSSLVALVSDTDWLNH